MQKEKLFIQFVGLVWQSKHKIYKPTYIQFTMIFNREKCQKGSCLVQRFSCQLTNSLSSYIPNALAAYLNHFPPLYLTFQCSCSCCLALLPAVPTPPPPGIHLQVGGIFTHYASVSVESLGVINSEACYCCLNKCFQTCVV